MMIVPFLPDHLRMIELQDAQRLVGVPAKIGDVGDAYTGMIGGIPIACVGVRKLWDGVGEGWAILSPEALKRPVALSRAVLRGLNQAISVGGFKRVQVTVAIGHGHGHRWAEFLGFKVEGLMDNYGPGGRGQYALYARIA